MFSVVSNGVLARLSLLNCRSYSLYPYHSGSGHFQSHYWEWSRSWICLHWLWNSWPCWKRRHLPSVDGRSKWAAIIGVVISFTMTPVDDLTYLGPGTRSCTCFRPAAAQRANRSVNKQKNSAKEFYAIESEQPAGRNGFKYTRRGEETVMEATSKRHSPAICTLNLSVCLFWFLQ